MEKNSLINRSFAADAEPMFPDCGTARALRTFAREDLPDPLGPVTPTREPLAMLIESPSRAVMVLPPDL